MKKNWLTYRKWILKQHPRFTLELSIINEIKIIEVERIRYAEDWMNWNGGLQQGGPPPRPFFSSAVSFIISSWRYRQRIILTAIVQVNPDLRIVKTNLTPRNDLPNDPDHVPIFQLWVRNDEIFQVLPFSSWSSISIQLRLNHHCGITQV